MAVLCIQQRVCVCMDCSVPAPCNKLPLVSLHVCSRACSTAHFVSRRQHLNHTEPPSKADEKKAALRGDTPLCLFLEILFQMLEAHF